MYASDVLGIMVNVELHVVIWAFSSFFFLKNLSFELK